MIRVGVVCLVAATTLVVAVRYPILLHDLGRQAAKNSALSYADRDIAGGNGIVADQTAVYAARGLIPANATYHVAVSPDFKGGSDLTVGFVDSYYRYFLMPRRPAEGASWVICYGCDRAAYGSRVDVVWSDSEGISILKVQS